VSCNFERVDQGPAVADKFYAALKAGDGKDGVADSIKQIVCVSGK